VRATRGSCLKLSDNLGLFTVASSSFLIAISSRQQVAQIRGKPIYVVTGVTLIPLSSQSDATRAIEQSQQDARDADARGAESDRDSSDDEEEQAGFSDIEDSVGAVGTESKRPSSKSGAHHREPSVAQDVIQKRGQYGRFTERWFSKKGWTVDKRMSQGLSKEEDDSDADSPSAQTDPAKPTKEDVKQAETAQPSNDGNSVALSLLPKLLRTTKLLFGSRNFYFSYDYDITRRWGTAETNTRDLPLHKIVDPLFFWNHALASPFSSSGHHAYVLPLVQGFVGQKAFTVDAGNGNNRNSVVLDSKDEPAEVIELQNRAAGQSAEEKKPTTKDYLLTLISRRSVQRPGLRYLRRGVDEDGHVANAVETEQLLSDPAWAPSSPVYSFTQIRGSIPLFFSQSPYSFKPQVVASHSAATNHEAFKRHVGILAERYGNVQIAMLVDKHGTEGKIGDSFEEHTKQYNDGIGDDAKKLGFEWFDFHKVCAGMKFENVNILMDTLEPALTSFGITREVDGTISHMQSGVLRTNCMDCLDRTNVVQSATAQRQLEAQLSSEGLSLDLQADTTTQWFNALWADNGDAISKQYSSTAALKGDFTRTRKRNYRGALNDFGLTLSRYYNNIVNDYFSQVTIDFLLGNVTDSVFEEFESSMVASDPGVSMKRVRQNAIDTSAKIVIADASEELAGGWTLATPHESNTLRSLPLEEVVLLLTDAAVYAVRFDWNTEKVSSFERIDLRSIRRMGQGVYITNTLSAAQTDPARNVGLVIRYRARAENTERVNTRSMSTVKMPPPSSAREASTAAQTTPSRAKARCRPTRSARAPRPTPTKSLRPTRPRTRSRTSSTAALAARPRPRVVLTTPTTTPPAKTTAT
jgi:hypothetical protein